MALKIAKFSVALLSDSVFPSQSDYADLGPCVEFANWSYSTYIENSTYQHVFDVEYDPNVSGNIDPLRSMLAHGLDEGMDYVAYLSTYLCDFKMSSNPIILEVTRDNKTSKIYHENPIIGDVVSAIENNTRVVSAWLRNEVLNRNRHGVLHYLRTSDFDTSNLAAVELALAMCGDWMYYHSPHVDRFNLDLINRTIDYLSAMGEHDGDVKKMVSMLRHSDEEERYVIRDIKRNASRILDVALCHASLDMVEQIPYAGPLL